MATDHERTEESGAGLTRRQILARGAVAAGVVWAAPVIRTASAYATSASGTERPCSKFYLVALDKWGPRPIRFANAEDGYDEMPASSVLAKFRPVEPPASTSTTTTSSTSSTTTSSTSSTTTSSTSSTTTTSTTTTSTTRPFEDPTEGLGLFPDGESSADPRGSKQPNKDKDKKKKKKSTTTTTGPEGEVVTDPAVDPLTDAATLDDLGLFPEESDPNAAAATAPADVPLPDDLPPGIRTWLDDYPDVPLRYPEVPPMLTQTGDQAWAVLLPAKEGGPNPATHQCRAVKGWGQSGEKYEEFYEDPDPFDPSETGLRLIFPNPNFENTKTPGPLDLVFLVYCCP